MLAFYFNELSDAKRGKINYKHCTTKLFLKTYIYDVLFESEEWTYRKESTIKEKSTYLLPIPALEVDEVKEVK